MQVAEAPRLNLEGFDRLRFSYDEESDIACIHLGAPRPALSEQVDDGWYLRITEEDLEVVGLELHGLTHALLHHDLYRSLFAPAVTELEHHAGRRLAQGLQVNGSTNELPKTTHLLIFLLGQAMTKLDEDLRHSPPATS